MALLPRYILPMLLLTLSAFTGRAASANFSVDSASGCAPLVVHFTNLTGPCSGCTYDWHFGNGTPDPTSPGPVSTSYTSPGTYTATLTVNDGGTITTHSVTITVYPPPTVSFTADDTSVCPGMPITFTSTTLGGVPGAISYTWSFGDGGVTTGNPVAHPYASPGYYGVTLFATNSAGCHASLNIPGFVHIFTPATPSFSAATSYFCTPPGHAAFTDLTGGTGPFEYTWEFGDGSPDSHLPGPTHDYTAPGSYTVRLVITDGHGCTDSVTRTSYIYVANLHAAFSAPDSACVNSPVTFSNASTPTTVSSTWTFGDGSPSQISTTGHHTYTAAGTYTVRLVISDGTCHDTITHTIVILPGPTASFTISPVHPCPPPVTLTFTGTAPAGTIITWLDGDGTGPGSTGSGTTFSHTYTHRGIYSIKMIAINPVTGCKDTIGVSDTLYDLDFHVAAMPVSGCKPLTVSFHTTAFTHEPDTLMSYPYPYGIASYSWNYGDGSAPGTGATPSHTYTAVGIYTAVVTATTGNGCTVTDSIKIWVGQPPTVTFTGTPLHECYRNNEVTFTATTVTGPATWFVWQFGDGGTYSDSNNYVTHHFAYPGVFSVTLTAFYNGCPSAPFVQTNYVTIDSPMSIISSVILCSPNTRVVYGDSSLGDDTHLWVFGDGTTSTADNPIHDYPANTTYIVTLATYNAASGCRDTMTRSINLSKPIPHFTADDTTICKDGFIHFTPTITGGTASEYFWYRNGVFRDDTSAIYLDTFHVAGIYTIMLVIEDQNGCLDTLTKPNYVVVAHPAPTFTASPLSGCAPLAVTFTDHTTDVTGVALSTYAWSYGDGVTSSGTAVTASHTFTASGSYITKEIVTDALGCKDSVSLTLVSAFKPTASFSASNVHPCLNAVVTFANSSSSAGATITSYSWSFGDGATSTLSTPTHAYSVIGTYTVQLTVTDSHGCTDMLSMPAYMDVNRPTASFYMDDSVSICPPLEVHFINTSTGGVTNNWTLGDGTSSTAASPSDLYITAGSFPIQLVVTNVYGCRDTAVGDAVIYGYAGAFTYGPLSGCSPLTVHFNASISNVPTIVWDFADGNTSTVSAIDSTTHVYTIPGAYLPKLILSDNTGCQSSSLGVDTIKVDGVVAGFTEAPNPVCLGITFNLVDTSKSYWSTITTWNWLFNSTTSTISSPSFLINIPGTYPATLQVTDGWGCTNTVTEDIDVFPPPIITASPDTIICVGDAATLMGYGGVSYTWAPIDGTIACTSCNPAMASPVVVTNYTVTGTDVHGCTGTDTTSVYLKTKTVSVAYMDTAICQGVAVRLRDSGATKFNWTPASGLSSASIADPVASPQLTTRYTVIAQLGSCIPDTNTVIITVYPAPTIDAGPDQTVIAGSNVQLLARGSSNITSYLWNNASIMSCDSCANPITTPSVTTHYLVTVSTAYGCTNSDTTTVFIYCDASQVFIPNTFTPNGDGQNDIFYPRGTGISIIKSFRIYNRWGELLFERSGIHINDAANAWDGYFNGGAPKPDVYVYIIDAICDTGAPLNLKGDVTIIR